MGIRKNLKNEILASFDQSRPLYTELTPIIAQLLSTVLLAEGIILHSATSRCKDRHSLEGKLSRPGKAYSRLEDITDLAGIRLTTYFADDVDRVAEILRRELEIDEVASVDKRIQSDPDRFGYLSLHFVAQLALDRVQLREYRRYAGLKFEIQIRSILQHAWAEIEHDLGYKSASGVPTDVRRRFARISGLLELADSEFCAIRKELSSYEQMLPELIQSKPNSASIDLPTLKILVAKDEDILRLDSIVALATDAHIESGDSHGLSTMVDKLKFFDIKTVDELKELARTRRENVRKFSEYWIKDSLGQVSAGIGLFYLCYVLAWESGDTQVVLNYLNDSNIDVPDARGALVHEILAFRP